MKPSPQKSKDRNYIWTVIRIISCIVAMGIALFAYIEKQNGLTELRVAIPALAKELKDIEQDNIRLTYEIERLESPEHLMELRKRPEFSHLKNSFIDEEIYLEKSKNN